MRRFELKYNHIDKRKVVNGMKQSDPSRAKELFLGSDIVRKYTFKTMNTRDNYALLVKANHQLSQDFAISRDQSVILAIVCPIQTAILEQTRGYSVHFRKDCFECLSPHKIAA